MIRHVSWKHPLNRSLSWTVGQASPMGLSGQEHSGKYVGPLRETPGGWAPTGYKEGYRLYNSTYRAVGVTTPLTHVFQAIYRGNDSIYN